MSRKRDDARIPRYDDAYNAVPPSPWGKRLCAPCHDTAHHDCLGNPCDCLCRSAEGPHKRVKRDVSQQDTLDKFGTIEV
jgi:hypothetical protein